MSRAGASCLVASAMFALAGGLLVLAALTAQTDDIGWAAVWFLGALAFAGFGAFHFFVDRHDQPTLRMRVRAEIRRLRDVNAARVRDALTTWADRGYAEALDALDRAPNGEDAAGLAAELRALRKLFEHDPDDAEGGATGAVGDALEALERLSSTRPS